MVIAMALSMGPFSAAEPCRVAHSSFDIHNQVRDGGPSWVSGTWLGATRQGKQKECLEKLFSNSEVSQSKQIKEMKNQYLNLLLLPPESMSYSNEWNTVNYLIQG